MFSQIEEDVRNEAARLDNADLKELSSTEPLVVHNVVKSFKKRGQKFIAVNNLSFGISQKECFGFLGLNGAGMRIYTITIHSKAS